MLYLSIVLQWEGELNRTIKLVDFLFCTNLFQYLAHLTYFKSGTLGIWLQLGPDSRKIWNLEEVMQPEYAKF